MLRVAGVNRAFLLGDEPVRALVDIHLDIHPGEYISVMGPSGSGKSTLLNVLGLLDRPDSGAYFIDDVDTVSMSEERRARLRRERIGFVFQSYHLIGRLSARENIELPLTLAGWAPARRRKASTAVIGQLGLSERAHHLPEQLSGGQRQRVAIGRAIVMRPEILLADEPTGNLDSRSGRDVVDLLESLNTEGITLLVVTHDAELGARARRHIRMADGAVVEDDGHGVR
ncbi:MAG: ABC transporter ATP-binding protein [Proteobacteria bacterium]|nr:MAG: ABC transporter ATP-binding protein [Pseudomonadota bacterium]